ncbi:MAG: XRE family transcriptional regulator [Clostridia bacterium]|nr:XRE family transcriptional regulator [Clostridia bacterium]
MKHVIRLKLDKYIDSRDITRYALAQMTGIAYQTIDKYYKNQIFRYDAYNLGKIVAALHCEVGDLLELVEEETQ